MVPETAMNVSMMEIYELVTGHWDKDGGILRVWDDQDKRVEMSKRIWMASVFFHPPKSYSEVGYDHHAALRALLFISRFLLSQTFIYATIQAIILRRKEESLDLEKRRVPKHLVYWARIHSSYLHLNNCVIDYYIIDLVYSLGILCVYICYACNDPHCSCTYCKYQSLKTPTPLCSSFPRMPCRLLHTTEYPVSKRYYRNSDEASRFRVYIHHYREFTQAVGIPHIDAYKIWRDSSEPSSEMHDQIYFHADERRTVYADDHDKRFEMTKRLYGWRGI